MEEELSLLDMFQILRRRIAIIIAIFIVITILAGILSVKLNKQEYSSTTSLLVGEEKKILVEEAEDEESEPVYETIIVFGNATISRQTAAFYNEVVKSKDVLDKVVNNLGLDISPGALGGNVSMDIPQDSGVIKINISGIDMINANLIADELARVFMDEVFKTTELENMKVMSHGSTPMVSNTQNIKLNIAIAMVLGIMVGVFMAFAVDYLNDRIYSEKDIEKGFGLDVISKATDVYLNSEDLTRAFINIQFSDKFKGKKTLVVTSPKFNRDTTDITIDLSKVITRENKKVLLIDANLRNPNLHKKFNLTNEIGFSNILSDNIDTKKAIKEYDVDPNIHIITAGSIIQNPSELLSVDRIESILDAVYDKYDYIILNAYSVNDVADTIALSAVADGSLMVLQLGVSKNKDLQMARKALDKVGANIVGSILY